MLLLIKMLAPKQVQEMLSLNLFQQKQETGLETTQQLQTLLSTTGALLLRPTKKKRKVKMLPPMEPSSSPFQLPLLLLPSP